MQQRSVTQSYHFLRDMPRQVEEQCNLYRPEVQGGKGVNSSKQWYNKSIKDGTDWGLYVVPRRKVP